MKVKAIRELLMLLQMSHGYLLKLDGMENHQDIKLLKIQIQLVLLK